MEVRKRREEVVPVSFSGFPVRSLTRNVEGRGRFRGKSPPLSVMRIMYDYIIIVSGEWVMAYQMQQKRRFRLSVGSAIASLSSVDGCMTTPDNTMSTTSTRQHNRCTLAATQLVSPLSLAPSWPLSPLPFYELCYYFAFFTVKKRIRRHAFRLVHH